LNVIAPEVAVGDDSPARLERLADLSQQLLARARALGWKPRFASYRDGYASLGRNRH